MTSSEFTVDLMTDKQCVRTIISALTFRLGNEGGEAYASPRTDAPALMARKGTAPHKSAAQGAEPGFESEWAMYKYPAVAVNRPMAVELNVRRSLINVSTD